MHLESALGRLQEIIGEIENKQLPLHEVMKLHEEGQKLVGHAEKLLKEAQGRLKVTEVGIDSEEIRDESAARPEGDSLGAAGESLF